MINMTETQMIEAWRSGNDAGEGFPVGNKIHALTAAAKYEGATNIKKLCHGTIVCELDGNIVVICDAYGPWAVAIGELK